MAGTAEDRVLPAPDQRAAPGRDPRGRDQGGGQGPGAGRHRHRLRRRAAPGQRRRLLPGPASPACTSRSGPRPTTSTTTTRRSPGRCPSRDSPDTSLGLAADFRFTRQLTQHPVKFSFTGPFSLSRRIRDGAYAQPGDLVRALARRLNAEARALAEAGADFLQIDEPFLAGYPEQVELAVEAVNMVIDGVAATWALHVCYGNRYARPSWEGHYDFLFPAVKAARVDQIVLEFARKGLDDLRLIGQHGWDRWLGFGVIDVKTPRGRAGRARRGPDQAGAGVRAGRPPDDQPGLRAAAPRARGGPAEAARHGGRGRRGPSRARIGHPKPAPPTPSQPRKAAPT